MSITLFDVFMLMVLIYMAVSDFRYKEISQWVLVPAILAAGLIRYFSGMDMMDGMTGALTGVAVLLAAKFTRQAVGYGDGAVILFLGMCLGWRKSLSVLLMTLLMISAAGILMLGFGKIHKKTRWPMVPWLLLSSVIGVMIW